MLKSQSKLKVQPLIHSVSKRTAINRVNTASSNSNSASTKNQYGKKAPLGFGTNKPKPSKVDPDDPNASSAPSVYQSTPQYRAIDPKAQEAVTYQSKSSYTFKQAISKKAPYASTPLNEPIPEFASKKSSTLKPSKQPSKPSLETSIKAEKEHEHAVYFKLNDQKAAIKLQQESQLQNIRVSTLKNNMKIVTTPHNSPITSLTLSLDMGAHYENPTDPLRVTGLTGLFATSLNHILRDPLSGIKHREEKYQEKAQAKLIKQRSKQLGRPLDEKEVEEILSIRFPTAAEQEAQEAQAAEKSHLESSQKGDGLFEAEAQRTSNFSTLSQNLGIDGVGNFQQALTQEKTPVVMKQKKTWRELLQDDYLQDTNFFVESHKEHVTISAYTTSDRIYKILKLLSFVLQYPDFQEEDLELLFDDILRNEMNLDEPFDDNTAIAVLTNEILYKSAFPRKSPLRAPGLQKLDKLSHFDHASLAKWQRLIIHKYNDKDYTPQLPLTLAIVGVGSEKEHESVVKMCEELFSNFYSVNDAHPHRHKNPYRGKIGAYSKNPAIKKKILEYNHLNLSESLDTNLNYNKFKPALWNSITQNEKIHTQFRSSRLPSAILSWADVSQLSLNEYVTPELLSQTEYISTKDSQISNQNKSTTTTTLNTTPTSVSTFHAKAATHDATFKHNSLHSTILSNMFGEAQYTDAYEPNMSTQLISGTILPNRPRTIYSSTDAHNTVGSFSMAFTFNRSQHFNELWKHSMGGSIYQVVYDTLYTPSESRDKLFALAKGITKHTLLQTQHVMPPEMFPNSAQTRGITNRGKQADIINTTSAVDVSLNGNEILHFSKTLSREVQLYGTYLTPTLISKIDDVTIEQIQQTFNDIFLFPTPQDDLFEPQTQAQGAIIDRHAGAKPRIRFENWIRPATAGVGLQLSPEEQRSVFISATAATPN